MSQTQKLEGKALSDFVYNELSSGRINAQKIQLCRTTEQNFPYNIYIPVSNAGSAHSETRPYNTVLLTFTQDDIQNRLDFIKKLASLKNETPIDFSLTILLTACDRQVLDGNESMTGSDVYAELIEGTESTCVLVSNLDSKKINSITPGSAKNVSPMWLVKLITTSLEKNNVSTVIKGNLFLSLYKLDILQSSQNLSSFLKRNIPATELNLIENSLSDEQLLCVYKDFLTGFSELTLFDNDVHYIPLHFFGKYYWVREFVSIVFLLSITFLSLVYFCDLGFIFRSFHSTKNLITKKTLRSFYLIPGTVLVLTLCLHIGQFFASLFFKSTLVNPIIVLGIKVIISFILVSIAYLAEIKLHKSAIHDVYEQLLMLSCLINIFIFSAIDITLVFLFVLIYLIIFISQFFKKTVLIYIFLILSILPYFLLIFEVMLNSTPSQLNPLIYAKPLYNLALSCAVTPFCFMLLRIYHFLQKNNSTKIKAVTTVSKNQTVPELKIKVQKAFPKHYIIIQGITVTILILILFFSTLLLRARYRKTSDFSYIKGSIEEIDTNNLLNVKHTDSNYYSGTIRNLFINTKQKAVRVEIFVSGETENPVFYTMHSYSQLSNSSKVKFDLPDFPPEVFSISYTPDNSSISKIDIYAYYDKDSYPNEYLKNNSQNKSTFRKTYIKEKVSIVMQLNQAGN
ncbi:hypothetical protein [Treponema sp.]|uniref:hypothetical protein n=1 Tax=Treponema sp. TaxID=166 RepID=UPI00298D7AB1|nr:hypothetical protein [Treponema sp.]MCR5613342.1 hypothetical protein [Treponema sp.]